MKRHANPKPTKGDLELFASVAAEAFPSYRVEWCSHGTLGGHRAPRDHTLAFRLVDDRGKYRSSVIWVQPDALRAYTVEILQRLVARRGGAPKKPSGGGME